MKASFGLQLIEKGRIEEISSQLARMTARYLQTLNLSDVVKGALTHRSEMIKNLNHPPKRRSCQNSRGSNF